ncbi:putative mitochondrial ribosomal protein L35 precursor [Klebsormidium nitens]|uniref:Putative mitochondrial ribosomal protein L35 n=1 Tax=Klebsormidium nitens TaxID=105231 RepID=A0A0U9HIF1_KLENI|nr:putative mitochondrial ribosomal protein L35 precursor [Klebsormidium nitens]|eukprot:GAQ80596.1 putative mitochondrial ribosomal protein L35 precursor [Klebsormidium nitens]
MASDSKAKQGICGVQCEVSGRCDLSQSRLGPAYQFEVSRSFATKTKKYKIKSYSSYKQRFWSMRDGGFKRMKAGKRHNASAKTKKQLRRLRTPTTTPPALAKVMRQLGFQGR